MKLETAINLLKKHYERAKKLEYVHNPVAFALYQTWKVAHKKGANK